MFLMLHTAPRLARVNLHPRRRLPRRDHHAGQHQQIADQVKQPRLLAEQQGDATREIARNIQQVAAGSNEISAHIGGVTTAAAATGTAASDVLSNARELDNQSGMLRGAVDEFLTKVRAA